MQCPSLVLLSELFDSLENFSIPNIEFFYLVEVVPWF